MATEEATTKPRRTRTAKAKETETKAQTDSDLTEYKDDKGKQLTVQQLKNKLRGQAERAVLDKYKKEVISHTEALYREHNLEYVRRLSDEEKAQKLIEELYGKFPNLRPQTEQQQEQAEEFVPVPYPSDPVRYEDAFDDEPAVPGPVEGSLLADHPGGWEPEQVEQREGE